MKAKLLRSVTVIGALFTAICIFGQSSTPAASAAGPANSSNAEKVRVAGVVRTSKGLAVPGATVRVVHMPSGQGWMSLTDEDGAFSIGGLPTGRYRIEARHLGLGTISLETEVSEASTEALQLTLSTHSVDGKNAVQTTPAQSNSKLPAVPGDAPKQAEKGHNAESGGPAQGSPGPAASSGVARAHPHHRTDSAQPGADASAPPQSEANGHSNAESQTAENSGGNRKKRKKDGFAQVDVNGQPSASTDLDKGSDGAASAGSSSSPDSSLPSTGTRTSTVDAFLINGTVGRGATAQGGDGFDDVGNDSSSPDSAQKQKKKHSHSGKGGRPGTSERGDAGFLPVQDLEDAALGQRLKHLGSNKVRLTLYDQYSNSTWNALSWALTDPNPKKIDYYSQRAGVSLGGPLLLPGYNGRDRTFFFVNYEIDRHQTPVDVFETVPTAAMRQGDFSALPVTLYDPASSLTGPRTAFAGNIIPATRINPTAVALLNYVPLPNLQGNVQNFHLQQSLPQGTDRLNVRVLHTISPKFNLQFSYNWVWFRGKMQTPYSTLSDQQDDRAQNATIGLTQNFTSRLVNETKVNFNRIQIQNLNGFANKQNVSQQLGINGISQDPVDFGLPSINLSNYTGLSDSAPVLDHRQTFRVTDNASYVMSRHTIRAGVEWRYRQINSFRSPMANGKFDFTGLLTSQLRNSGKPVPNTGYDVADFLLGFPQTTGIQYGIENNHLRDWWYVGYVQDDWRITPRLSVNVGARYEYVTPFIEENNHLVNLDLDPTLSALAMVIPGVPGPYSGNLPRSLIHPDTNNWAPRFGIAWRPLDRGLVIRAGYGIFYNGSVYDQLAASMLNQPPFAIAESSVTGTGELLTLNDGFAAQTPHGVLNTIAVDPNYKVGYAEIWNLTVDMPLNDVYGMEMTYTGTKGTHLDTLFAPNQAVPGSVINSNARRRIPNAGDFTYETSDSTSIYNGLQVRFQRRETKGFRFKALYTFSKSMDDASAIGVGTENGIVQDFTNLRGEWGLSTFDVRHQLRNWLSYEPPFGDNKRWLSRGAGAALFGNWRFSTIAMISSGAHFTPILRGANVNGTGALYSQRPDIVADPTLSAGQGSPFEFFNTAAFAFPADGQFGNARRGSITGPGYVTVNVAVGRTFRFGSDHRYRMEFRWEAQNVLNTVNYTGLNTVFDSASFGRVRGARPMRSMDVFMRMHF